MSSLVFSCVLWLVVYFWTVAFFVARTLVNDFLLWFQLYLKEYDVIITRKQKRGEKNNPHASAARTIPKRLHPLLIADYPQEKRCNFIHFTFFGWPNRTKTVQAYNGNFFYYSVFLWCARAHKIKTWISLKLKIKRRKIEKNLLTMLKRISQSSLGSYAFRFTGNFNEMKWNKRLIKIRIWLNHDDSIGIFHSLN